MKPDLDEEILYRQLILIENNSFQLALKGIKFLSEALDENCEPEIEK